MAYPILLYKKGDSPIPRPHLGLISEQALHCFIGAANVFLNGQDHGVCSEYSGWISGREDLENCQRAINDIWNGAGPNSIRPTVSMSNRNDANCTLQESSSCILPGGCAKFPKKHHTFLQKDHVLSPGSTSD